MANDPTDLRARQKEQRDEEGRRRAERQAQIEDVKWLLSHPQGRRFIWRLLEKAGIYRSTFNSDHSASAFAEGVRSVGLMIIADVFAADPDAYATMMKEQPR